MKSLIISSNGSGGGKTTFTLGLMKALKDRGYEVQGYKAGPDYIDPGFHKEVTKRESRNLDLFLMGEEGVLASYNRGKGEIGIIEGVMGLYDGRGIDTDYSTYHLSETLDNTPIVLVITPKAQSVTLCAELNGIKDFKNANIVGVVLNKISEKYYKLLKSAIEANCSMKVFGYIPKDENIALESRHLGLVQSVEVENIIEKIDRVKELIETHVDVDGIIDCLKERKISKDNFHVKNIGLKTAVAYDEAFRFYYKENLELLEELGEIRYFSPLKDAKLPEDIDFLYLGGGYPEVFKEELSKNLSMRNSIKKALESGLKCYGECGGLMYLMEEIEGNHMVGFLKGKARMTKSLNRFGYAKVTMKNNPNIAINCHEFHKSTIDTEEEAVYNVEKQGYDGELLKWNCGYFKNNTLGGYPHIHFFGNLEFLMNLISLNNKK